MFLTGTQNSPASVEGTGLETDKMSKKHIEAHFDALLGKNNETYSCSGQKDMEISCRG